ncbi:protein phosphatase 1L-like [Ptychodera flava]|uniref:protein phosphatase 1L-like n=1 Tax=Ptychodera flava TaxID=63121 RepID=UPI00396A63EB
MTLAALFSRYVRQLCLKYETWAVIILFVVVYSYVFHTDRFRSVLRGAQRQLSLGSENDVPDTTQTDVGVKPPSHWELRQESVAVYAIQGKRPRMEDRYDVVHDEETGLSMFGIFDGHGGQFAAEFTEKILAQSVLARELENAMNGANNNHSQILTEEILSTDEKLISVAKTSNDVAGTTCLFAILDEEQKQLIVANVGDSRGVLCDHTGKAVPLSYDHKPHQLRERKRIKKAGGFISYNGVWRVAGVLATSRALGDYPLKDKKLLIANPDILTFELDEVKPQFLILATDGLWDAFTNEEAVMFIKERLDEPHFGAKSLVLQAYYRGSPDNITVMVVNFNHKKTKKMK